jgi:hypothetical protein
MESKRSMRRLGGEKGVGQGSEQEGGEQEGGKRWEGEGIWERVLPRSVVTAAGGVDHSVEEEEGCMLGICKSIGALVCPCKWEQALIGIYMTP